jgi:CheY-like chemotaxis protein
MSTASVSHRVPDCARQQDPAVFGPRQRAVILSVDDDLAEQTVLDGLLKEHYTIHQVSSLEQCREHFNKGVVPDLVLLDLMMPAMEGVDVLTMIRQEFGLGSLDMPVLVTSAATESHVVVKAFKAGCNNFIPKPLADEVLLAQIETIISMKNEHRLRINSLRRPSHSSGSGFPSEAIEVGDEMAMSTAG